MKIKANKSISIISIPKGIVEIFNFNLDRKLAKTHLSSLPKSSSQKLKK